MKKGLFYIVLFSITFSGCNGKEVEKPQGFIVKENEEILDVPDFDIPDSEIKNTGINKFWNSINSKKIKLFVYTPSREEGTDTDWTDVHIVNSKGIISKDIIDNFTKELSQDSIKYLTNLLANTTNYWDSPADCFNPRHGIVFYNSKNKIVGHISICFECNSYHTQPEVIHHVKIDLFETIFKQHGFPTKDEMIRKYLKENPQ